MGKLVDDDKALADTINAFLEEFPNWGICYETYLEMKNDKQILERAQQEKKEIDHD